jgi:hypothetical protein
MKINLGSIMATLKRNGCGRGCVRQSGNRNHKDAMLRENRPMKRLDTIVSAFCRGIHADSAAVGVVVWNHGRVRYVCFSQEALLHREKNRASHENTRSRSMTLRG